MQSLWILCTAKPPEGQEAVIGAAIAAGLEYGWYHMPTCQWQVVLTLSAICLVWLLGCSKLHCFQLTSYCTTVTTCTAAALLGLSGRVDVWSVLLAT